MRSGPKAILYRDCLFRVSELIWVKAHPLSPLRLILKIALIGVGVLFFFAVAWAKGTYKNLEELLGFFVFYVGWTAIVPDTRLASTGDLLESYEARGGSGEARAFRGWIAALGENEDECKFEPTGAPYTYWFNLSRVAWAKPTWLFDLTGLIPIPLYLAYAWLIQQDLPFLKKFPMLDEVKFLTFPEGNEHVVWICWAIALLSVLAVASSFGRGLEVRACGGLTDTFRVNRAEQQAFLGQLAGLAPGTRLPAPDLLVPESKLVESKPVESKVVESKPVAVKPIDVRPVEVKAAPPVAPAPSEVVVE